MRARPTGERERVCCACWPRRFRTRAWPGCSLACLVPALILGPVTGAAVRCVWLWGGMDSTSACETEDARAAARGEGRGDATDVLGDRAQTGGVQWTVCGARALGASWLLLAPWLAARCVCTERTAVWWLSGGRLAGLAGPAGRETHTLEHAHTPTQPCGLRCSARCALCLLVSSPSGRQVVASSLVPGREQWTV